MDLKKPPFEVELTPETAQGTYANLVVIGHSLSEFILDFSRIAPGAKKVRVYSRVIMTPQNAQLFRKALDDNLKRYEAQFGKIKIPDKAQKEIGFK